MPVSAAAGEALGELVSRVPALAAASGGRLLECFALVPDPRDPRGVRHPLPCVLALCAAAVLNGNSSFEDVAAWAHRAPQEVLAACGARRDGLGVYAGPHPDTTERVFRKLGAHALAGCAGAYLALRAQPGPAVFPLAGPALLPALAVGGKAVRGAAGADGRIPYLLAAAVHGTGAVLAERLIGPETNEVPEFGPLLLELNGYYPLAGHVITAGAGHTVKAHATLVCGDLLAHYVFTVRLNTPALYAELDALDWGNVPRQVSEERGRGRWERRTIQVQDVPEHVRKRFPHARQAALIERYVTRTTRVKKGKHWVRKQVRSAIAVFVITSLDAREASPEHIAGYVRLHWTIENKVHWVRDVTSARIPPWSGPAPVSASWSPSATSPSASSARPATPKSPPPSGRSNTTPACYSPSSASRTHHDQCRRLCGTPWVNADASSVAEALARALAA
jgi:predicted transposase YbfD/YdcC